MSSYCIIANNSFEFTLCKGLFGHEIEILHHSIVQNIVKQGHLSSINYVTAFWDIVLF